MPINAGERPTSPCAAGRLLAAQALGAHDQLLSEALLARDIMGRITGETQRLYKNTTSSCSVKESSWD